MTTPLIITSDLHQHMAKWRDLVRTVERETPRFVLICGDLLPKEGGFEGQRRFFPQLAEYLAAMRASSNATVLLFFGNDDLHPHESRLDELASEGLCVNLNERIHREAGFTFCGMCHVRDYPFGYKHWCAPDGDYLASPVQFCGEGLTVDDQGHAVPLPNLRDYLRAKPSLHARLKSLRAQLTEEELPRSIWLIHNPPAKLGMDICHGGREVGSPEILKFIQETQPLLGCSGHIHESPYQAGGQWAAHVGGTFWVQAGQESVRLHYVSLQISPDLELLNPWHSVFGPLDADHLNTEQANDGTQNT